MGDKTFLEDVIDIKDSEFSVKLLNFHSRMKQIRDDMKNVLDLLDIIVKERTKEKKIIRKKILDSYNDLPRESEKILKLIVEKLKE